MKSNSETLKVAVMGVVGLIICLAIIYSTASQFFGNTESSSQTNTQVTSFPTNNTDFIEKISSSTPQVVAGAVSPNSVWQQPVNEYVYENNEIYKFDEANPENHQDLDNFSSSEGVKVLNSSDLIPEIIKPSDIISEGEDKSPIKVAPPEVLEEPEYPNLGKLKLNECGELVVPSGIGLAFFAFTAGENPAVKCLGEAVAKRCADSNMMIQKDGLSAGFVYVIERPDKVCSVGLSTGSTGAVSLCSIEKIMNSDISKKKSIKEWQLVFKSDPGDTFASMYFDNSSKLSDPALASQFDCQTFKFVE